MKKFKKNIIITGALAAGLMASTCISCQASYSHAVTPQQHITVPEREEPAKPVRKVLFIGDSMTGWLAEALNGYGRENGFEVATIVWDGSTIQKWADSPKLTQIINEQDPDAVFVSLGMNELFEANPEQRLSGPVGKLKRAIGERPLVWVGPPSWPGHNKGKVLDEWLMKELGSDSYFSSFNLNLPRQSSKNPHPTREGMIKWVDSIMQWVPESSEVHFESVNKPKSERMVRGKTFIYKRMKEQL